ncbi:DEAD/DEAH box helicase [Microbacterium aurantiacum]|uniref:DEAD/DEAH box helicase n=1 Tax=Microbacterium aurantiacum TaxID=162393 RepID=UPI003D742FE0
MTSHWRDLLGTGGRDGDGDGGETLALGLELRRREPYDPARWEPRGVATVTTATLTGVAGDLHVALRPLMRGSRGDWIRGDVSWESLRRGPSRFRPDQVRWFAELHALSRVARPEAPLPTTGDVVVLDEIVSTHVWPHLRAASDAGVPLVSATGHQEVTLAEAASARVAVDPRRGGGLRLSADIELSGLAPAAAVIRPVGRSGLYAAEARGDVVRLILAAVPLPMPLPRLLLDGAVDVPASDTDAFLVETYPRLARSAPLSIANGVPPPPEDRPTLGVDVTYRDDGVAEYGMRWRYPGAGVAFDDDAASAGVVRDAEGEARIIAFLEGLWSAADAEFQPSAVLADADAAAFATAILPELDAHPDIVVTVEGTPPTAEALRGDPRIRITAVPSSDPDWFDLGILVWIDGRPVPFGALFRALSRGRARMKLADGGWFSLRHPALRRLKDLLDEAGDLDEWETGPRIARSQISLWADFEDLADESDAAAEWRALVAAFADDGTPAAPPDVPAGIRATLRPYQRDGLSWLARLHDHRLGGILADDMGLGKTLQLLSLVARDRERGGRRPWLVVAPTSVVTTWHREAARFAPDLRVAVIDGTAARRDRAVLDVAATADVVVASYGVVRIDADEFAALTWAGLILDEAQFVKNPATRIHRAVAAIRSGGVFAVTGTPMENSVEDLWALLSLTAPGLFPSRRRFREEYVRPLTRTDGDAPTPLAVAAGRSHRARQRENLRRRTRPFLLRRTKEHVAPELPAKQEQEIEVRLSPAHRALYDRVLQRERQKILGLLDDLDRQRFIVFRSLTLLRMLSLAPALIDERDAGLGSAKLDVLVERIAEVRAEGHRVLVFSQFTSFLDLAGARLSEAGIVHTRLDGTTRGRDEVVEEFRSGRAPVFLISLKAGGFGLTLTEAEYVFLLDPWWNPAAESQAVDRAHRIGQSRSVFVYRLIAAGTIEEKVRALQQRKADLIRGVLDDGAAFADALDASDIRSLLEP